MKIKKREHHNITKYEKDELDIAYEFAKNVKHELKDILKAIILFGSTARMHGKNSRPNDIDIMLIVDDVSIEFTPELIQTYRIIVEKIILKVSRRLHITTLKFTNFWEYIRAGDPIAINILRDGVAMLDTGFFSPLQVLLYQGRIRPSKEAINNYMMLAPQTLNNSKGHIIQGTLDLYWAVIDSAHAALMSINEIPPSPAHVSDMLDEKLVKTGLLKKRHSYIMRQFYALGKSIMHGEILEITGQQYDTYMKDAREFVSDMRNFIEKTK